MWLQGIENAPPLVRACFDSWQRWNPDWEIVTITAGNIDKHVTLPAWTEKLSATQRSDLVRLLLLERFGGVWVDATTWCNWPLDAWLGRTEFFAFAWPSRGYELSSWFMASVPGLVLVSEVRSQLESFWRKMDARPPGAVRRFLGKILVRLFVFNVRTTELWLTAFVRDLLKVYPYFAIHYVFARVIRTNECARSTWLSTTKVSADGPHMLQKFGTARRPDRAMLLELSDPTTPVYKLSWKEVDGLSDSESVLSVLLRTARDG